jgi:hypothetical protein
MSAENLNSKEDEAILHPKNFVLKWWGQSISNIKIVVSGMTTLRKTN